MFAVYIAAEFNEEIIKVLLDQAILKAASTNKSNSAKVVNEIVVANNLTGLTPQIGEIVLDKSLTFKHMSGLLKIKLSHILKKGFKGNKRSLILLLVGIITILAMNGLSGLCLVLEALRKLFEEGQISEALYESLKEAAEEAYLHS